MIKVLTRKFANKLLQDSVFFQLYHFSGSTYRRIYSYQLLVHKLIDSVFITWIQSSGSQKCNVFKFVIFLNASLVCRIQRIDINSASIN